MGSRTGERIALTALFVYGAAVFSDVHGRVGQLESCQNS